MAEVEDDQSSMLNEHLIKDCMEYKSLMTEKEAVEYLIQIERAKDTIASMESKSGYLNKLLDQLQIL